LNVRISGYLTFVHILAGTDSAVSITLYGAAGEAGPFKLAAPGRNCFEQGSGDVFNIKAASKLGQLQRLKVSWRRASQPLVLEHVCDEQGGGDLFRSQQPASWGGSSGST
jgi:hypothetical protein